MKKALRYALVLGVICLVAALGVSGTYALTRDRIRQVEEAERTQARGRVLPAAKAQFRVLNVQAPEPDQVVEARDEAGVLLGYAALGAAPGYAGPVRVMVGMDPKAETISGITVVAQSETPGLGTRVAEVKSAQTWFTVLAGRATSVETTPEFLKQFPGRRPGDLALQPALPAGVQAITGATVTSRAVVAAAQEAVAKIHKQTGAAVQAVTGATTESH